MKKLLVGLCRPIIRCFHNFSIIILFAVSAYCSAQSVDNYLEKVYLDIDKTYYLADETIWFKAYLVDGRTNTKAQSEVLYVDLIDPEANIVETKTLKISGVSGGAGEFQLSPKLVSGDYTIRAYTNYMRNFNKTYFFRKKIYIESFKKEGKDTLAIASKDASSSRNMYRITTEKPDVQFLPESGVLVNEISNRVAFKVVDANGKSLSLNGVLKDNAGNKVSSFSSSKFGMGIFMFKPKKGAHYKAYINLNDKEYTYDFPVAVDKGANMIVRNNTDNIHVVVQSTFLKGLNGLTLVGKQFGEVMTTKKLSGNKELIIKLKTEKLKEGIVKFTILDEMQRPLSERLVFVEKKVPLASISIDSLKSDYHKRDLISFDMKVSDITNKALLSNMSISVSEVVDTTETHQLDIKSHLLLKSELKGTIENPSFYFKSKDANRLRYLDLLMLTQGWRKYVWTEMDSVQKYSHDIESGFNFKGSISNFNNHEKKNVSRVEVSFINGDNFSNFESKTTEDGMFHLGDYDITDSTSVIISAKGLKRRKHERTNNFYFISLDSMKPPSIDKKNPVIYLEPSRFVNNSKTINERLKNNKIVWDYKPNADFEDGGEQLDEIRLKNVKAKLEEIREEKRGFYYGANYTLHVDDVPISAGVNFTSYLYQIPGVNVVPIKGSLNGKCIRLRGSGCAKIFYNGRPIYEEMINSINTLDIDFIDVFKGTRSAIFGMRAGFGGVIAIYSKDGRSEMLKEEERARNYVRKGIINIEHPGYSKAKEFYSPMYNTADSENDKPDYRSTLYWNPNLKLNEDGKAMVSFYASDIKSKYKIEIEGITSDGIPVVEESFITVE